MSPAATKRFRQSETYSLFMAAIEKRNYEAARKLEREFEILWNRTQGIPYRRDVK